MTSYWVKKNIYNLVWGNLSKYIRSYGLYYHLYFRIRWIEKNTKEKTMEIMNRFVSFWGYKKDKENKAAMRYLMEEIARVSESTGVPQWEIRGKIQRDFNIDI